MAISDSKNKTYICRVNGTSIYWSHREAKKDSNYFVLLKNGKQVYRTEDLYGAINTALGNKTATSEQKKKFLKYAKEHDSESIERIKRNF